MKKWLISLCILCFSIVTFCQKTVIVTDIKIFKKVQAQSGKVTSLIPQDIINRQKIVSISYSPNPDFEYKERDQKIAEWDLLQFQNGDTLKVQYTIELTRNDFETAQNSNSRVIQKEKRLKKFLLNTSSFQFKNSFTSSKVHTLITEDKVTTAKNIHNYVINNIQYQGKLQQDRGSKLALKSGVGDCTEYSETMIALCRGAGIPARIAAGTALMPNKTLGYHNWVELYFEDYGWVSFDPTWADGDPKTDFNRMRNSYIYLSFERFENIWGLSYAGYSNDVIIDRNTMGYYKEIK